MNIDNLLKYKYYLIAIVSFVIYAQTIGFELTYCDDHDIILTYFDRISNFSNLTIEFFKGYIGTDYYRPLINISFMVDALIAGQELWIYHLSNIIYHTIFAFFLFNLFIRLDFDKINALFFSLIFVVHPLNVNAVAWIVGRNDSIMSIFSVLSFIFALDFFKKNDFKYLLLFALFSLGAFLSKESGIFFLPVIFLYLILIKKIQIADKKLLSLLASSFFSLLIWFAFRTKAELGENINKMGFDVFLFNIRVIPEYISKFFFPFDNSVLATYSNFHTFFGLTIIFLLFGYIFINKNSIDIRKILFGFIWFIMPIFPTLFINILNVSDWNEYVECRAYLPIIGLIIILNELFAKKINLNSKLFVISTVTILIILSTITIIDSQNYKNSVLFYESAVIDNQTKPQFYFALSRAYRRVKDYKNEEIAIKNTMYLRPKYAKYPYNLGVFFYHHKKIDSSIKYLNIAIKLDSNYKEAYKALGTSYFTNKHYKDANYIWNLGDKKFQDDYEFKLNLITSLFMLNEYSLLDYELEFFIKKNIFKKEIYSYFLNSGDISIEEMNYEKALKAFEYCIKIDAKFLEPYIRLFDYYLEIEKNYVSANKYYEILKLAGTNIPQSKVEKLEKIKN